MLTLTTALVFLGISFASSQDVHERCHDSVDKDYSRVFDGKCYYFAVDKSLEYPAAASYCWQKGGYLAIIKSMQVNEFIYTRLNNVFNFAGTAWIGLNDIETEEEFEWVDGSPLTGYNNFVNGEGTKINFVPNFYEDCIAMDVNSRGVWRDYSCTDRVFKSEHKAFVCEFPTIKEVVSTTPGFRERSSPKHMDSTTGGFSRGTSGKPAMDSTTGGFSRGTSGKPAMDSTTGGFSRGTSGKPAMDSTTGGFSKGTSGKPAMESTTGGFSRGTSGKPAMDSTTGGFSKGTSGKPAMDSTTGGFSMATDSATGKSA